ncbi:N-formylglutamate amidohydrolase [Candidatus Poriferisodalis sp.]|uniref:N-formylglutamate amidohydrolase n=1 Tax=Candidatus Poriferisodalis sp. TaxID=3101277 RepID=UPI003B022394
MSKLPLVISVPHAGLRVPAEVTDVCSLSAQEIADDGDGGAAEIYSIQAEVEAFVTTDVARAIVDMNRAPDDRRTDGVVKTHTCWNVPVYRRPLRESEVESLLGAYHAPYHDQLSELGRSGQWPLGVDCHTMAASGPPVGPDHGKERPWICLSNGDGTCPPEWIEGLRACFAELVDGPVNVNDPFRGGYITRSHGAEMPWMQLEMSRAPFMTNHDKRQMVLTAFSNWVETHL